MLYNFGLMYNSVKEVYAYYNGIPTKSKTSFDAGYQLGSLFYHLLVAESVYTQQ